MVVPVDMSVASSSGGAEGVGVTFWSCRRDVYPELLTRFISML